MSANRLNARWPLVGRNGEEQRLRAALVGGDHRSAAIVGPPGVGKSRLADELMVFAADQGIGTCRLAATPAGREIPLGVFFGVLTVAEPSSDQNVVQYIVDQVSRIADGGPLLLVVDDAHEVDSTSALVIHQIAVQGLGFVVLTRRDEPPAIDPLPALWKDDAGLRVDLGALSAEETERLAASALDGHIEGSTARTLWEITRGNPLYLREVLVGAEDADLLDLTDGVWRLLGFPHSPGLNELVESRLADVTHDERDLLDHLALAEPLPLELAEALAAPSSIARLETSGLLSVVRLEERTELFFAHPVHGEVLRALVTPLRALAANRRLADTAETIGGIDPIRSAVWRLDGGGNLKPRRVVAAARHAHFAKNSELAERLARAAWDAGGGAEAGMLLGEALLALGRHVEADRVLATVASQVTAEQDRAQVAMNRAETLFWGLGRSEDSDAVLAEAANSLGEGAWRDEVLGMRAMNLLLVGRPRDAAAAGMPLLERAEGRARVEAATVLAPALAVSGRTAEAIGVARRAYDDCVSLGDQLALSGPGVHLVSRSFAEIEAGLLAAAASTARTAYDRAIEQQSPSGQAWAALLISRAALWAGPVSDADRFGAEGALLFRDLGQLGQARWCLACRAWALASQGERGRAAEVMKELDDLGADHLQMMEVDVDRARAWSTAADPRLIVERLQAAGAAGLASGTLALAAGAFHDLVRFGRADLALDPLTDLATQVDGELMPLRLAHAKALLGGEGEPLQDAAEEFERLGVTSLAAETWAQASAAWRTQGRPRNAHGAGERARRLAGQFGGLATPAMVLATPAAALTRREREIAALAAAGRPNRDIATELTLSIRTVENHLQRAFDKLGATGRNDLAALLQLSNVE